MKGSSPLPAQAKGNQGISMELLRSGLSRWLVKPEIAGSNPASSV